MKYDGVRYICECGNYYMTKHPQAITKCKVCRGPLKTNICNATCDNCGKTFYSKIGKTKCQTCFAITHSYKTAYLNQKINVLKSTVYSDPFIYKEEVRRLLVKSKWNMSQPIDNFSICHIFLNVFQNEVVYSSLEIDEQIKRMLSDLELIIFKEKEYNLKKKDRWINKFDKDDKLVRKYKNKVDAAKDNNLSLRVVSLMLGSNRLSSRRKIDFRLRWSH